MFIGDLSSSENVEQIVFRGHKNIFENLNYGKTILHYIMHKNLELLGISKVKITNLNLT
jgi:hypothetical protein